MFHYRLVRPLREAGLFVYVPREQGKREAADAIHLETAAGLGAVLVTQNKGDFALLHHRWQAEGRSHAGILLTAQISLGRKIACLQRAARLLTPEAARNQLMELALFETDDRAASYVASLTPPA